MNELSIITEQQQAGRIPIQPPNSLHTTHRALARPLPQWRRQ